MWSAARYSVLLLSARCMGAAMQRCALTPTAGAATCGKAAGKAPGYQIIEPESLAISRRIGAGTEKHVLVGEWAMQKVAVMEIFGSSRAREFALQRRIAEHETLGQHPHLVRALGETSDGKYIVNELADLGSLTNYDGSPAVLNRADLGGMASLAVRLVMSWQICEGTKALLAAGLLHRDLAARNVLCFRFSPSDPSLVLTKLTDFGLTIEIGGDPAWPKGHAMGTRWMAPESQPDAAFEFSEKSEVYMLGVVIWEVFSNGRVPYDQIGNGEIGRAKRRGVLPGPRPRSCTDAVWELLQLCWEPLPVNRPSLGEVSRMLSELRRSDGERLRPPPEEDGPWVPSPRISALDEAALAPEFKAMVAAASAGKAAIVKAAGDALIEYDAILGVYSFPLFTNEFCDEIVAELTSFVASGRQTSRANTNNRHSLKLSELGFNGMLEPLAYRFTEPLASVLLPGMTNCRLRFTQGHTVQRVFDGAVSPIPGSNRGSKHFDGADVTLNVNIGGEWSGGDLLVFRDHQSTEPDFRVPQKKGWAVFHPGRVMHQAALLEAGSRYNLVIWADMI
mmetsp:Transcript_20044/g.32003  ORF Transcript_20044/g.32003 Transcript_20044/m.32003 type:complete len:563 (-) Transcript_20044:136-1824(-)